MCHVWLGFVPVGISRSLISNLCDALLGGIGCVYFQKSSVSEYYDKQCYVNIPVEACCSDAASDNVLVCTNADCVYKNCEIDTCVQCRFS